ncbi:hypothetical protein SUGI_0215700 [Cryptomeria japonica]|nr:hypothetical protein SUGI_0215700 [Cryptomeria japonica]
MLTLKASFQFRKCHEHGHLERIQDPGVVLRHEVGPSGPVKGPPKIVDAMQMKTNSSHDQFRDSHEASNEDQISNPNDVQNHVIQHEKILVGNPPGRPLCKEERSEAIEEDSPWDDRINEDFIISRTSSWVELW